MDLQKVEFEIIVKVNENKEYTYTNKVAESDLNGHSFYYVLACLMESGVKILVDRIETAWRA